MQSKPKTIFETIVNILSEQDVFSASADYERRAFEIGQERTRQQAQKAREAKAAQEASAEAEGNQKLQDLRFKEQNARNAVTKLRDIGRGMEVTKQFARGDFNKSFGLPPAEKPRMAQATKTSSQPTEPAVPTAEPTEPAVPTAEPVAPEPMTRRATRQVASNNPGRKLYENNRFKIILETVANILQESKYSRRTRENRAARGDEEAAIADVVLRGFTSPEVTKKAEALERRGERRMGWEEKGSAIRKKAAGIVKARRARTEKK